MPIKTDDAIIYCKKMADKHGAVILRNTDGFVVKFVAWFLDFFNIIKKETFLFSFSITIGKKIYLCFDVGSDYIPLYRQIAIVVHELCHVKQGKEDLFFRIKYLLSKTYRLRCEIDAIMEQAQAQYAMTGNMYKVEDFVDMLRNYRLNEQCLNIARYAFTIGFEKIKRDGIFTNPWELV